MHPPTPDPTPEAPPHDASEDPSPIARDDFSRASARDPNGTCDNCGCTQAVAFCPECGQRNQPLQQPVHQFVVDALKEYFGIDGRLWRTLWRLVLAPGALTVAYLQGQRVRYLRPLRIYLTCTLLFFLLLSVYDPTDAIVEVDVMEAPDTLVAASVRLAEVDSLVEAREARIERQEVYLDSLRTALATAQGNAREDSLSAVSLLSLADSVESAARDSMVDVLDRQAEALDELADDVEDEADDLEGLVESERYQRLRWERSQLRALAPDSLVVPMRYEEAAALLAAPPPDTKSEGGLLRDPFAEISAAQTARTKQEAGRRLARAFIGHVPTALFVVLPLFALFLKLLYVRRSRFYSEHLVFTLHVHAFAFLVFATIALLVGASDGAGWASGIGSLLLFTIPIHVFVALKKVYQQGWIKTFLKFMLLGFMYNLFIIATIVGVSILLTALFR